MKVIGIDQSYERTGIAYAKDDKLQWVKSIKFDSKDTKKEKRAKLSSAFNLVSEDVKPDMVVVERVRLYSRHNISTDVIIALGSLIAVVIDNFESDVYSVDTRSWKARVVGSAKVDKAQTVEFLKTEHGFEVNHDAADAACIALYPFRDGVDDLLKKENK